MRISPPFCCRRSNEMLRFRHAQPANISWRPRFPFSLCNAADRSAESKPSKDSNLDIFEAAYRGDTARATELAKLNPAIARLRSPDGRTPLHFAAAGGQVEMISFLTMQGADLSAGPESPLLSAVDFSGPSCRNGNVPSPTHERIGSKCKTRRLPIPPYEPSRCTPPTRTLSRNSWYIKGSHRPKNQRSKGGAGLLRPAIHF